MKTLKITVPMAGLGSRMRPHTWSKPKPLIALAGKTVLDFVLEQFDSALAGNEVEYILIVGPNQREQVEPYLQAHHPEKQVHFVLQEVMRGQSDALYLAREHLKGPMLLSFSDTLIESDLSDLDSLDVDCLTWVKPVEDPRRFGVAQVNSEGWVTRLVEKPQDFSNNLVLVGFYYFRRGEDLIDAIQEQIKRGVALKNEYFLADAVNIMLERGARMRPRHVDVWLDAGIPATVLETNRYLLDHGRDNSNEASARDGVAVIPPVYIHPEADIKAAVIGPHVSIGKHCRLERVVIHNAVLDEGCEIKDMVVADTLLGRRVKIEGRAQQLNLGDDSWLTN